MFMGFALLRYPKGTVVLCLASLTSVIAFALILFSMMFYLQHQFYFSQVAASDLVAVFAAANFMLHLVAGWLGGRYIRFRHLFVLGLGFQIIACIGLYYYHPVRHLQHAQLFHWLACFVLGSGMNVTSLSCLLTQQFEANDGRREKAFFWYYSAMNIGFFIALSISGYATAHAHYLDLFSSGALACLVSVLLIFTRWTDLKDAMNVGIKNTWIVMSVFLFLFVLIDLAFHYAFISDILMVIIGIMVFLWVAYKARASHAKDVKGNLQLYLLLAVVSLLFWTIIQLSPNAMMAFIQHYVDRDVYGYTLQPQWFENIDSVVVILAGPFIAAFYRWRARRKSEIEIPKKFSIGLLIIGLGYLILCFGIDGSIIFGKVPGMYVVTTVAMTSLGEVFMSPVGFAMIGSIVPKKLQGLLMGNWLMITGMASALAGFIAHITLQQAQSGQLASFLHTFYLLASVALSVGMILFMASPFLQRFVTIKQD